MARSKTTARKSTGGKAPRKMLAQAGGAAGSDFLGMGGAGSPESSAAPTDYEHQFDALDDEIVGKDWDMDDKKGATPADGGGGGAGSDKPAFMFFDFRVGAERWPKNVELITSGAAADMISKKKEELVKECGKKKEPDGPHNPHNVRNDAGGGKGGVLGDRGGKGRGDHAKDPRFMADTDSSDDTDDDDVAGSGGPPDPQDLLLSLAPPGTQFETLNDGSTALVVPHGARLKLCVEDLIRGGDENRAKREREAVAEAKAAAKLEKRRAKRPAAGFAGYGGEKQELDDGVAMLLGDDDVLPDEAGGDAGSDTGGPTGAHRLETNKKKWYKDTLQEWTVTMDVKIGDSLPHEGVSLIHTALLHSEEIKGRVKIKESTGETTVNCDGGMGCLGTFGDTSKAQVEPGKWHRLVASFKCGTGGATAKGELRTWIDTIPACVVKSEEIATGSRFELDVESLFLFSSNDPNMMPGVSVRTVRVEALFADDQNVLSNRARDRVISMLNEERKRKIDKQRRGLSLAALFAKPRPIWSTPALIGTFGDAYIEGSGFEGTSCLAWSFSVINLALQKAQTNQKQLLIGFDAGAGAALSDAMHVLNKSAGTFKQMAQLMKSPTEGQLMGFLRRTKKAVNAVDPGEMLMLPIIVEGQELLILLIRTTERSFDFVIVSTDAESSLQYHPVSAASCPPKLQYRTCLVLNDVDKKNAVDDVFWTALYNMTAHGSQGDMRKFYDILLPFLTGKPLEMSLLDAESLGEVSSSAVDNDSSNATAFREGSPGRSTSQAERAEVPTPDSINVEAQASKSKDAPARRGRLGAWRDPQRSSTAYVRCVFEAMNYILLEKGLSQTQVDQVHLALQAQLVDFIANDMQFILPDENGTRCCEMAISVFSAATVRATEGLEADALAKAETVKVLSSDTANAASAGLAVAKLAASTANEVALAFRKAVPEGVRQTVLNLAKDLNACIENIDSVPALLELTGKGESPGWEKAKDSTKDSSSFPSPDSALMQFQDHLAWEVEENTPDPGQAVTLRKYDPINLLAIPEKASTRDQAVKAIRLCDEQCTMIANQDHCVKNPNHLIVAVIEHVFVQVVDVPKPRKVTTMDDKQQRRVAAAVGRKKAREEKEKAGKAQRMAAWASFKGKGSKKEDNSNENDSDPKKKNNNSQGDVQSDKESSITEAVEGEGAFDVDSGLEAEAELHDEACYWDQPLEYGLQVELMICLQRLTEQFAAAAMSVLSTRSFDAVCTTVPGIIAAIADAVVRRNATDRPSKFTSLLMGMLNDGRKLGMPGFGISVSSFAEQSETMELHYPELSVARTAVLDYFQSPDQARLEKIFDWEVDFVMRPSRNLVKLIRSLARSMAVPIAAPHHVLIDGYPEMTWMLKNYPEFRPFRDIVTWWKYFLNPDVSQFPNFSRPDDDITTTNHFGGGGGANNVDVQPTQRLVAQLKWGWSDEEGGYQVSFGGRQVRCRPDPNMVDPVTGSKVPPDELPKHRYASTATPAFYCSKPAIKTEDDVIYRPNLPSFDEGKGGGQVLSQRDSELLISYLTVPYLRLPLVLTFFASDDRVHKLQSSKLKGILDSVLFEPGRYLRVRDTGVIPAMVPTQHSHLLSTSYGLLANELHRSPHNVFRSISALLTGALALDTGAVCDLGATDFNTGVDIILYVTRLCARVDSYVSFLVDHAEGKHPTLSAPLRGVALEAEGVLPELQAGLMNLRARLHGEVAALLEEYLDKLDREMASASRDSDSLEALIDRNSRLSCDLHAHRLLLYRNVHADDLTPVVVKIVVGSFVFLTTRHTWNKAARRQGRLLVPETELYEILQVTRRRLITWARLQTQGQLDVVLQTALQVSSSSTGSMRACAAVVDAANRWSKIAGMHSIGRYAVASTRTVTDGSSPTGDSAPALTRVPSLESAVGEVADTGMLGVEMDLQLGQMTLRSKHLQALETEVANHPDVKLLFGDSTMQASLLERATHRRRYRLVGLGHEVEYWSSGHESCPPLLEQFDRDYDPSDLSETEKWIAKLFEPVRTSFFDGPSPPPMQFMMAESIPAAAEVAVLVGLHPILKGPWKIVYVHRRLKCVHVFECVSQARQWWFTLHMTTDARFCLRDMQPSCGDREQPYPAWWQNGAGGPFPSGVNSQLTNDLVGMNSGNRFASVVIKRDAADPRNLSGGVEVFVPARLLLGLIPECQLLQYQFWQDESCEPSSIAPGKGRPGWKRLRGYPVDVKAKKSPHAHEGSKDDSKAACDSILFVEFQPVGSWLQFRPSEDEREPANTSFIEATGMPGRTVRVYRRTKMAVEAEFHSRRSLAAELERLQLVVHPAVANDRAYKPEPSGRQDRSATGGTKKNRRDGIGKASTHKVGDMVEFDSDGTDRAWVLVEITKVHKGDCYDLEPKDVLWVAKQTEVPAMFIRQKKIDESAEPAGGGGGGRGRGSDLYQYGGAGGHGAYGAPSAPAYAQKNPFAPSAPAFGNNGNNSGASQSGFTGKFDGLSDSEDEGWMPDDDTDDYQAMSEEEKERLRAKNALTFDQFDRLGLMLEASGFDIKICVSITRQLVRTSGGPYVDVARLAREIAAEADKHFPDVATDREAGLGGQGKDNPELMLNLFGAPRKSRLHSLLKVLVRIENASHICAWTRLSDVESEDSEVSEFQARVGCPPITLVELPRLKLSFTVRPDHAGTLRLYSLDHSDLFVCNDRHPLVVKMIQGIPQSLLLSNLKGELQVLVPVLCPRRPRIGSQPFSTMIVLDRSCAEWANALTSPFFLYPIHACSAFLLTKGLHAAIYLMLLRLLHRDYPEVFRLTDSIATDTAFTAEGNQIFSALGFANGDCHPDAHACRLKISLVTMDSGCEQPWDLTIQCAKNVVKQDSVAGTCRLAEEEELQLLENTSLIVLDESHLRYNRSLHTPYTMTLVKNRLFSLRAYMASELTCPCFHPPRLGDSMWPWHTDNTILGEVYEGMQPLETVAEFDQLLAGPDFPDNDEDADTPLGHALAVANYGKANDLYDATLNDVCESPEGLKAWFNLGVGAGGMDADKGFLTLVTFHVVWSPDCVKLLPDVEELAASFPTVKFATVRADKMGLDTVSKAHKVASFPTFLLFRGSELLQRLEGADRAVARLGQVLRDHVTADDERLTRALRAYGGSNSGGKPAAEDEEQEDLVWTWDGDFAPDGVRVVGFGTVVAYVGPGGDDDEGPPVRWQVQTGGHSGGGGFGNPFGGPAAPVKTAGGADWTDFEEGLQSQIERAWRAGEMFRSDQQPFSVFGAKEGWEFQCGQPGQVTISGDEVNGFYARSSVHGSTMICRRKGSRSKVKGDEVFCDKNQIRIDKYEAQMKEERRVRQQEYLQKHVGHDCVGTRGTHCMVEETGVYRWTMKWNHEPARGGTRDAVGLCSEVAERFGPCDFQLLGCHGACSLGLYATGELVYNGKIVAVLHGPPRKTVVDETPSLVNLDNDDTGEDMADAEIMPKCPSQHQLVRQDASGSSMTDPYSGSQYSCNLCYKPCPGSRYWCGFCHHSACNDCWKKDFNRLNAVNKDKSKAADKGKSGMRQSEADPFGGTSGMFGGGGVFGGTATPTGAFAGGGGSMSPSVGGGAFGGGGFGRGGGGFGGGGSPDDEINDELEELQQMLEGMSEEDDPEEYQETVQAIEELRAAKSASATASKGQSLQKGPGQTAKDTPAMDLRSFIPPEPEQEKAPLWGKGSKVTLLLNTGVEGGELSFFVDGVELHDDHGQTKLPDPFGLLGSAQITPCLCFCPLDKEKTLPESEPPPGTLMQSPKPEPADSPGGGGFGGGGGGGGGKGGKARADHDLEQQREEQKEIANLARICRRPFRDIEVLTVEQRDTLKPMVETELKRRIPNVMLILGEDEAAAQAKAQADAALKDKELFDEAERVRASQLVAGASVEVSNVSSDGSARRGKIIEVNADGTFSIELDPPAPPIPEDAGGPGGSRFGSMGTRMAGGMAGGMGFSAPQHSLFGASGAFGASASPFQQASPSFGASGAFGASASPFQQASPSFGASGAFGASASPAFGGGFPDPTAAGALGIQEMTVLENVAQDQVKRLELEASDDGNETGGKVVDPKDGDAEVPISRVVWMHETEQGWKPHSSETSAQMEKALRDGKAECSVTIGAARFTMKLAKDRDGNGLTQDDDKEGNNQKMRLRRHILSEGLAGEWEMLSQRHCPPVSLIGNAAIATLGKLWAGGDNLAGNEHGLGFLFLYKLMQGSTRVQCISSGFSLWSRRSGKNDAHRYAMLLAQLMRDKQKRSIMASCVNILSRNKHICVRMPKFKDNRRDRQVQFFNGWCDEQEPRSPLSELFTKLMPALHGLKKQRGALRFPPKPPFPEMKPLPTQCRVRISGQSVERAEVSDTSCSERTVKPVSSEEVLRAVEATGYKLGAMAKQLPIQVEDAEQFDTLVGSAATVGSGGKLTVVFVHADWCGPCQQISALFRQFSMMLGPSALFIKLDIDDHDKLAQRFQISSVPTLLFMRGGSSQSDVKAKIEEGGAGFANQFWTIVREQATEEDAHLLRDTRLTDNAPAIWNADNMQVTYDQLVSLCKTPLVSLSQFVKEATREERGLPKVSREIEALDGIVSHQAAGTAVARQMLARMTADVASYSDEANDLPSVRMRGLEESDLNAFFQNAEHASGAITGVRSMLGEVLKSTKSLRDSDKQSINDTVPLVVHLANFVDCNLRSEELGQSARTLFVLRQASRQVPNVWVELLFGSTLSTQGSRDLMRLNPFMSGEHLDLIMRLITISMLRANRVGHANRCIGEVVHMIGLIDKAIKTEAGPARVLAREIMYPQLIQGSQTLAEGLTSKRHFMRDDHGSQTCVFDPRFLLFEFVWNLLLREKQVSTVNNFMRDLSEGTSKVKQMIMGAGKTTVVAPLLALMLADGKSLVLSVVPKALLEMSRMMMRETFATIMTKRIYTLSFDRSTVITPGMHRSLENAKKNRGVVVATPTTLKSIQLVYVETLTRLEEARRSKGVKGGVGGKVSEYNAQATELFKVLSTFREGVLLLDEVDMVLHPLKSELNFPIGDKWELDGTENGERWSLPTHLVDAIFFVQCGRVTTFEQSGGALEILAKLKEKISDGYARRALQKLPHVTLLDPCFYHTVLKPILAEWTYLWLQKQHLHGIEKDDAIRYVLEGAIAKSDLLCKVELIEKAASSLEAEIAGLAAVDDDVDDDVDVDNCDAPVHLARTRSEDVTSEVRELEQHHLAEAKCQAKLQWQLLNEIFNVEDTLESHYGTVHHRAAELSSKIAALDKEKETLENVRDDSLDNNTIICFSTAFAPKAAGDDEEDYGGPDSLHIVCGDLEEDGVVVKRCGDPSEALERARELQVKKQLRCVVYCGGEHTKGCGDSCTRDHDGDGNCLRCGYPSDDHDEHMCHCHAPNQSNPRGSFKVKVGAGPGTMGEADFFTALLADDTPFAKEHGALPASRAVVYGGNALVTESARLPLWNLGVAVRDCAIDLNDWISSVELWEQETPDTATAGSVNDANDSDLPDSPPALRRQMSLGAQRLEEVRRELEDLHATKSELDVMDECERKDLNGKALDLYSRLALSVEERIHLLEAAMARIRRLFVPEDGLSTEQTNALDSALAPSGDMGIAASGWKSAVAVVWCSSNSEMLDAIPAGALHGSAAELEHPDLLRRATRASKAIATEVDSLGRIKLAAMVMALVPSPLHKKLLNLSHDWLRTFLPHCLAKVNRVSFGLLNSAECRDCLQEDQHMPRSRLAMAVPFLGKDVPSKSSEFAHPDITIGLTVMAYRYSGLRDDNFSEIMDAVTSQFAQEIGPARERASSVRYESWVMAAGGRVRGVSLCVGEAAATSDAEAAMSRAEAAAAAIAAANAKAEIEDNEVVQLKFLQKSNQEQMRKLRRLWNLEPEVLHFFLNTCVFPEHMRTQKIKLSASGQSIGGDMLVKRRVGFSGTPSNLLPKEMGACEYEVGDDGKMLSTVLDVDIMSHELLQDGWSVPVLLDRIANADPPFRALIDTGALITGFSNKQVAQQLLRRGLEWCDGVVFLDDADKQQVLVRSTGRSTSADQCGVPLEKRFAFYDQIHTTGMDIKHVVNATAVITLGKDMVFRDYVQGAYRMRGIGQGQKIHAFVIPEVQELMRRELGEVQLTSEQQSLVDTRTMLKSIVAWLVVNSMRSEQTQWSMLCLQNVSNLYRKTAFEVMMRACNRVTPSKANEGRKLQGMSEALNPLSEDEINQLTPSAGVGIFEEPINFDLEAGVPDPKPFEDRLREMLVTHDQFILDPQERAKGEEVLAEVAEFAKHTGEGAADNKLETEQEREQEQEQQKEVKARRDQQVEIEKFVDREYSRNEEAPSPWPLKSLLEPPPSSIAELDDSSDHPFYPLKDFHLRHQESLALPDQVLCSRNYFNPNWSGLRRIKNVCMVMEWAPQALAGDTTEAERTAHVLRLLTEAEHEAQAPALTPARQEALHKAFLLLSAGKTAMSKEDLSNAVAAATDTEPGADEVSALLAPGHSTINEAMFTTLLRTGRLHPAHSGRYYVAVSLAEAETLRRVLHVKRDRPVIGASEVALRYSPISSPSAPVAGDGGVAFDASVGWRRNTGGATGITTGATPAEASRAHNALRYFDGDMHYSESALNVLVRALQFSSTLERQRFFAATIGVRRRMDRRWAETPLAKVFTLEDEYAALKQRAQAVFVREAIRSKGLRRWEAFMAFDSDDNGMLGGPEIYGALRSLHTPELTPEDVIDFLEAGDTNRDGLLDHKEYSALLGEEEEEEEGEEGVEERNAEGDGAVKQGAATKKKTINKVQPFGSDVLREVVLRRKREDMEKARVEKARMEANTIELDRKIFEEELIACQNRKGGANPQRMFQPRTLAEQVKLDAGVDLDETVVYGRPTVEYRFTSNSAPLRTEISIKQTSQYEIVCKQQLSRRVMAIPLCCDSNHKLIDMQHSAHAPCSSCKKTGVRYHCEHVNDHTFPKCRSFMLCEKCVKTKQDARLKAALGSHRHQTYLCLPPPAQLSLRVLMDSVSPGSGDDAAGGMAGQGAAVLTGERLGVSFSVTMEIMLPHLPSKGGKMALLRFAPSPRVEGRAANRREASVYVSSDGCVTALGDDGGLPSNLMQRSQKNRLSKDEWHALTAVVDGKAGTLHVYINGEPTTCDTKGRNAWIGAYQRQSDDWAALPGWVEALLSSISIDTAAGVLPGHGLNAVTGEYDVRVVAGKSGRYEAEAGKVVQVSSIGTIQEEVDSGKAAKNARIQTVQAWTAEYLCGLTFGMSEGPDQHEGSPGSGEECPMFVLEEGEWITDVWGYKIPHSQLGGGLAFVTNKGREYMAMGNPDGTRDHRNMVQQGGSKFHKSTRRDQCVFGLSFSDGACDRIITRSVKNAKSSLGHGDEGGLDLLANNINDVVGNPATLALGSEFVLFGGTSRTADLKGGCVTRVRLSDGCMQAGEVALAHHSIMADNQLNHSSVLLIQCSWRMALAVRRKKELTEAKAGLSEAFGSGVADDNAAAGSFYTGSSFGAPRPALSFGAPRPTNPFGAPGFGADDT